MSDTRSTSLHRSLSVGDTPISSSSESPSGRPNNQTRPTSSVLITIPNKRVSAPHSAHPANSYSTYRPFPSQSTSQSPSPSNNPSSLPPPPPPPPAPASPQSAVLRPTPPNPPTIQSTDATQDRPAVRPYQRPRSQFSRMMLFLGYGRDASRSRRLLVSFIWNMFWGSVQVIAIIVVLAIFSSKESPTMPGIDEWTACERPLGAWLCIWIARVSLVSTLAYWSWASDRKTSANRSDPEARPGASEMNSPVTISPRPVHVPTAAPSRTRRNPIEPELTHAERPPPPPPPPPPHSALYRRLSLLSSLTTLTWFLTAHILIYTSANSCRYSSPHIWWLAFSILCITYLVILEVLILGLVVFVIAPLLFLIWNIFLICIGRHPLQNPHMIKPEIGKLPKTMVDNIPLVMYIPPPPDSAPSEGPMKIPDIAYSYPPKPQPQPTPPTPARRRFRFIKKISSKVRQKGDSDNTKHDSKEKESSQTGLPTTWEDHWELEGYPFVVLEGNRAACAICLMDFEEPKRIHPAPEDKSKATVTVGTARVSDSSPEEGNIAEENRQLQLEDAGEGAQPLRLLTCGHVFHKTCLDPWLIDVSGRCPTCQRPVEFPEPQKKTKKSGGRS
ncbi:hypothetical protein D9758_001798 [Tetrapyrgos nigripes]|uniref:RING-type domain-containing protein n=1 Tax=Tetrapyrgos nigripes TaxID=182062 RepID=A0A8H5LVC8_9AGAR|nr:hypothetical protein D9758_001798 [Tetrapyrgos nigripes]